MRARDWQLPALLAILALAAVLRFWDIQSKPGFDWDEPVYTSVGANVALHGLIQAKNDYYSAGQPYLYHPPFYFLLLGGWFKLVGVGIAQARVLAAAMSLAGLLLLYGLLQEDLGSWSLLAITLVATDGWMVFSNRVSWLENTMMPLGILALWVYKRAVAGNSGRAYLLAGALLGAVTIFKHVGIYFPLAVGLEVLLCRRFHRGIVLLAAAFMAVCVLYVAGMLLVFRSGTHNYYWDQTFVQLQRTLGKHESRGTISSPAQVLKALVGQYKVFVGTLLISAAAVLIWAWSTVRALRARTAAPLLRHSLLYAWFTAAIIFLGAIQLKFTNYYQMLLIPMYAYFGAAVRDYLLAHGHPPGFNRSYRASGFTQKPRSYTWGAAALAALLAINGFTFWSRIAHRDDNALARVAAYTSAHLPPRAVILTEESVGTIVTQPYCKMYRVQSCPAPYIIVYTSETQQPPNDPLLHRLIAEGRRLAIFQGFKERITVIAAPSFVR